MFLTVLVQVHAKLFHLTKSPFKARVPAYWMLMSSPWLAHTTQIISDISIRNKYTAHRYHIKHSLFLKHSSNFGCILIVSSIWKTPTLRIWDSNVLRPIMLCTYNNRLMVSLNIKNILNLKYIFIHLGDISTVQTIHAISPNNSNLFLNLLPLIIQ